MRAAGHGGAHIQLLAERKILHDAMHAKAEDNHEAKLPRQEGNRQQERDPVSVGDGKA